MARNFTLKEYQVVSKAFQTCDKDGSGLLSREEIKHLYFQQPSSTRQQKQPNKKELDKALNDFLKCMMEMVME